MLGPSVEAVDGIARVSDPVVRNLQITQCYHELSQAFAELTGREANWCSYATWASKQAGQSIRGEDPRRAFETLFRGSSEVGTAVQPLLVELGRLGLAQTGLRPVLDALLEAFAADAALTRASEAVAAGNLKVFDEIAREFVRFLSEFHGDAEYDAGRVERFTAALRSGEPPEGQDRLREAFAAYARARFETGAKKRAELMLRANLLIGYHEQVRLQPDILAAMNAGFGDEAALKRRMLSALVPRFWLRLRMRIAALLGRPMPLDALFDRVIVAAQDALRRAVTGTMMQFQIADAAPIRLGSRLNPAVPARFRRVSDPELRALIDEIGAKNSELGPETVQDWADFDQRIRFIADLFRAHHEDPQLFEPPFSYDQEVALKAGLRPAGRL